MGNREDFEEWCDLHGIEYGRTLVDGDVCGLENGYVEYLPDKDIINAKAEGEVDRELTNAPMDGITGGFDIRYTDPLYDEAGMIEVVDGELSFTLLKIEL